MRIDVRKRVQKGEEPRNAKEAAGVGKASSESRIKQSKGEMGKEKGRNDPSSGG